MIELDDEESENTEEEVRKKATGEKAQSRNSQGRQAPSDGGVENVDEEDEANTARIVNENSQP